MLTMSSIECTKFFGFIYDNDDIKPIPMVGGWLYQYGKDAYLTNNQEYLDTLPKLNLVQLYDVIVKDYPQLNEVGVRELVEQES
jgi:hypothetical protein